ncbi:4-oxalocrotonate tautomerase DmpI [Streptomyces sp. UNOB3_S3]|uniref:4-oxalocrotonate tautomerase DmpI n=1 Tax=Streptomyces sp. UNOB3_S3 TaxID=2871682 RepID=UPI0023B0C390|nr:4-oxalocrotonate tautomerase DmpI [Streptomyces sp. UNOB3_S3]
MDWFRTGERPGTTGNHRRPRRHPMPVVTVQQGPRSIELKRDLVRRITDAFVDAYQIPAEAVQVWIQETPAESWGQAGTLTADK